MKNKLLYSLLILSLSLVSCVPDQDILPYNNFILEDGARPWVIGHGGTKALFPENTMLAFAGAMEIGVDVLEMDIKLTKDNILVCHHDNEIDRMSNGSGIVHDFTYAELKAFNFGYTFEDLDGNRPYENDFVEICLLKDVFEAWPEMYFNVEIKDTGDVAKIAGEELLKLIESNYLKSQIIVASFSDESLDYFQELSGNTIPVSASKGKPNLLLFQVLPIPVFFIHPMLLQYNYQWKIPDLI